MKFALPLLLVAVMLGGCGTDDVTSPAGPGAEVRAWPGPSYAEVTLNGTPHTVVHTPTRRTRIPGAAEVIWRADGRAVVVTEGKARVLDPATGRWLGKSAEVSTPGLTPEALTTLDPASPTTVRVLDPNLAETRTIDVPTTSVETDQLGEDAEFQLHGRPFTLAGVTWVEWGVNSEDDTRRDHGLLRIDGDTITESLHNEPLVRLQPSTDGSALLAVMQDNGEDEDCGGCQVEQRIVELDPESGDIAADYGMPPGYTRDWRIAAMDRVGDRVAAQFVVRRGESGGEYQTWRYDGDWHRVGAGTTARVRHQEGGSLEWTGDSGEESSPFGLVWRPSSGRAQTLRDRRTPCPTDATEWTSCPEITAPGALLPE